MADRSSPPEPRRGARRRERAWPFVLVFLLALAVIGVPLAREQGKARRMVTNEDEAVRVLRRLRSAQVVFHAQHGRYGWLQELADADLLHGLALASEPRPQHVRLRGYRIDVLLPYGRLGGENLGIVAENDPRSPDPELRKDHVSLVARPLEPMETGWRAFYLDEDDRLFLNEGVVDAESAAKNTLPHSQVKQAQPQQSSRVQLWQLADQLGEPTYVLPPGRRPPWMRKDAEGRR